MALNRTAPLASAFIAAFALVPGGSGCRSVSLCGEPGGCAPALANGGAAGDPGSSGGEPNQGGEGGAGQGGADAGGSSGGAGEAGESGSGPTCQSPLANCDGSALTGCETDLRWNPSHCGGCGQLCDGACMGGICHASETILEVGNVDAIVATETHAYTVVDNYDAVPSLLSIELSSGAVAVMTELPNAFELHKGADKLYLRNPSGGVLYSVAFDGTTLVPEGLKVSALATSGEGLYYESEGLWFRPYAAGAAPVPVEGLSVVQLLGDGNSVIVEADSDLGTSFYFMRSDVHGLLGPSIENAIGLRPLGSGVVIVAQRPDNPDVQELHWLMPQQPPWVYRLDGALQEFGPIGRLGDRVALELKRGPSEFVLLLDYQSESLKIGIPTDSTLIHIDSTHVWFVAYGGDFFPRLMRARYF